MTRSGGDAAEADRARTATLLDRQRGVGRSVRSMPCECQKAPRYLRAVLPERHSGPRDAAR